MGLIVNPRARCCRDDPNLEAKLRYTQGGLGPFVVAWNQTHLEATLRDWAASGIDLVAVTGGDGTNLYAITAIVRAYQDRRLPRIAFLGGGTNNIARGALGLAGTPQSELDRLLAAIRIGAEIQTVPCDVMAINDLFGFFFGAGMVARFYEMYYRTGAPSRWTTLKLATSLIASVALGLKSAKNIFEPVASSVRIDDDEFPGPHRIFLAAKMDRVALGLRPTYRAREQVGRFHVLLSNEPPATYATQWWRLFQGRAFSGRQHIDRLASRMAIRFDAETPYMVDGELFRGTEVVVTSGPVLDIVSLGSR